jgi:hypothetical protein
MTNENAYHAELDRLRNELQSAVPPIANTHPRRNLWPRLLQRIETPSPDVSFRMPWFDWALLGIAATSLVFFPALIPALLYHL